MHWYKVVKEVRGNRYLYLQHSYRVGGRKNPSTLNIYCGRADEAASWRRASLRRHEERQKPPQPRHTQHVEVNLHTFLETRTVRADGETHLFSGRLFRPNGADWEKVKAADPACVWTLLEVDGDGGETVRKGLHHENRVGYFITAKAEPMAGLDASEVTFVDELLDMSKPIGTSGELLARWDLKATKARPWQHVEAYEIATRMGVTVKTQIAKGRSNGAAVYNISSDTIAVPDVTRFRAGFGMSAEEQHLMSMLHETVHATMKRCRRPVERSLSGYAREELVAEIGAWVVARRLGIAPKCHDGARRYLQEYWGCFADRDATRAWVEREVAKAADFIVAHHSKGGWKKPVDTSQETGTVCPDCGGAKDRGATVCVACFPA